MGIPTLVNANKAISQQIGPEFSLKVALDYVKLTTSKSRRFVWKYCFHGLFLHQCNLNFTVHSLSNASRPLSEIIKTQPLCWSLTYARRWPRCVLCFFFFCLFLFLCFLHLDISNLWTSHYLWRWQCVWKLIKHIREQEVSKGTLQNVSHYFLLARGTVVLQGQHHRVLRWLEYKPLLWLCIRTVTLP